MKRLCLVLFLFLPFMFSSGGFAADEYPRLPSNAISVALVDFRLRSGVDGYLPSISLSDLWPVFLPPRETDPTVDSLRHMHANVVVLHHMNVETEERLMEELRSDYPFSIWTRTVDGSRMAFLSRRLLSFPAIGGSHDRHTVRANALVGNRFVQLISVDPRSGLLFERASPEEPGCTANGNCVVLTSGPRRCFCRCSYRPPNYGAVLRIERLSVGDPRSDTGAVEEMDGGPRKLRSISQYLRSPNYTQLGRQSCSSCRHSGFGGRCERCGRNEDILFSDSLSVQSFSDVRVSLPDNWGNEVFSRRVPVATLAFRQGRSDAVLSLDFSVDQPGLARAEGGTSALRREHESVPIELPCP